MIREIDALDDDRLLNTNPDRLCAYFTEKYRVIAPKLIDDNITVDAGDIKTDTVSMLDNTFFRHIGAAYPGTIYFRFHIPFTGLSSLFDCQPSQFTFNKPAAEVRNHELVMSCYSTDSESDKVEGEFRALYSNVEQYLGWVREDVDAFNTSLKQYARGHIEQRRERIMKARQLGESFGFKLRRRDDAPTTYAVPVNKRKLVMPNQGASPWMPDPTLELDEYNSILDIIMNMSQVIERSPAAFQDMQEEHLRNHFLVQLNGQYEGDATGETFNFSGKSDILIRHEGMNLFVAECKFWDGSAALAESIDQLLGYTTWRDTKTALLVFNKDRQLTTVLKAIEELLPKHARFKRAEAYDGETAFRYILGHPDDSEREIMLTILVFEVPR